MKKILAMMLTAAMMLSMGTAVMAADAGVTPTEATTFKFVKKYVTTEGKTPAVYPAETLEFTVTADEANPDDTMITIVDHTVDGNPDDITVTIPSYSEVGKYNYTVKEEEGTTQGVNYSGATFGVQVLVTYNAGHTALEAQIVFTTKSGDTTIEGAEDSSDDGVAKIDTIVNEYDLGSLDVSKTVTGELGDREREFVVKVTFNATGDVKSDITYVDGTETKTITAADMADKTETVPITVKHDETVKFTNIPAGITYTVVENDYTNTADDNGIIGVNGENGYDAAVYKNSDNDTTTTGTGAIADDEADADTVEITNNKGTTIDTGISVDSIPYIAMLGVVAVGGAGFMVSKKRRSED